MDLVATGSRSGIEVGGHLVVVLLGHQRAMLQLRAVADRDRARAGRAVVAVEATESNPAPSLPSD